MFSELGLKLPASTVNRWVHATANALYPLYESQREAVMAGGYTQIDEVVWRIADRPGGTVPQGIRPAVPRRQQVLQGSILLLP